MKTINGVSILLKILEGCDQALRSVLLYNTIVTDEKKCTKRYHTMYLVCAFPHNIRSLINVHHKLTYFSFSVILILAWVGLYAAINVVYGNI